MSNHYQEYVFWIELVLSAYPDLTPDQIIDKAKEELDVELKFSQVSDYLYNGIPKEDYEKESWTISSNEIF